MIKEIENSTVEALYDFLGYDNLRYFDVIKRVKGDINCVLRLNASKRGIPVHPVHLREGMQIRNWMRTRHECTGWTSHDFDNNWVPLVEMAISKFINSNNKC